MGGARAREYPVTLTPLASAVLMRALRVLGNNKIAWGRARGVSFMRMVAMGFIPRHCVYEYLQ